MLSQKIKQWVDQAPDKVALQIKREKKLLQITYADLWARSLNLASTLRAGGVQPGDRVALFATGSPEWIIAYLGIHMSGAVVVPIDSQYGKSELQNLLSFAGAITIITDPEHLSLCKEVKPDVPVINLLDQTNQLNDQQIQSPLTAPHSHQPDDVMSIIFTSGTTGEPKGVQLTCRNIGSNVEAILKRIKVTWRDNILNILPLHHAYASTAGAFSALAAGATVTFSTSLSGPDLMAIMQETGVTILPGVPRLFTLFEKGIFQKVESAGLVTRTVFRLLYGLSSKVRKATGIRAGKLLFRGIHKRFGSRLRFFVSGGARLEPQISEHLLDLGFLVLEGYGLTETSPVISFTSPSQPCPGSVGTPLDGIEVRIDNPDPSGQGEICMRGPNLMKGYYRNDKATEEVIRDGWFHTGDLGQIASDGSITITGRLKEIIVLPSGKNIYPDEVEAHYQNTPLVKEMCIVESLDSRGKHQGLCAVVVPDTEEMVARGVTLPRKRIQEEMAKIAAKLPSYMRPTDLILVNEPLPRSRLGKVRRHKVLEMVKAAHAAQKSESEAALSEELKALTEQPVSSRFIERLTNLLDTETKILPSHDLEMDLGADSLMRVEISSVLEKEFGLVIPDEEAASIRTVGDILKRLTSVQESATVGPVKISWAEKLREPSKTSLDDLFNLNRGLIGSTLVRIIRLVLAFLVHILFRPSVRGMEKLPAQGPVLLCPTHQSYVDSVLIYTLFPWRTVKHLLFVGFGEIFLKPPLSWIRRYGRVILTGGASTLEDSLKLSAEGLHRGMSVCIFPEGAMTLNGEIMEPKPGAGILACELGVPIYPIVIDGSIATISNQYSGLRRCRVRLIIGDPIYPPNQTQYTMDDYEGLIKRWYEVVVRTK